MLFICARHGVRYGARCPNRVCLFVDPGANLTAKHPTVAF